jgi:hypothetical protein
MEKLDEPSRIIDALGGTGKVAEICDLTDAAISQWRNNGIPKAWLKYFKAYYPAAFRRRKAA